MGSLFSYFFRDSEIVVHVTTGDKYGAGTDSNVCVKLFGANDLTVEQRLDHLLVNDHERGQTYSYDFHLPDGGAQRFGEVSKVQVWRDDSGFGDSWFLERIEVEHKHLRSTKAIFPVLRWIKADEIYTIHPFDCFLPQDDPQPDRRRLELEEKKKAYTYVTRVAGGPAQVAELPSDEQFSEKYMIGFVTLKGKLAIQSTVLNWQTNEFKSIDDIKRIFVPSTKLTVPKTADYWFDDQWFGLQRVQGANPVVLKLCTEIPDKLGVTDELVEPFLEGFSLKEALDKKKLFIVDLEILEGIKVPEDRTLCTPIALFFLNKDNDLMPVAIQLFQQKAPDNPVFVPSDPKYTWLLAKTYFNNADAMHHQSCTHLGNTHLVMEGVCVCTNRHLSLSHPVYKILAPHFLYLLAINTRGLEKLVSRGGWVDTCTTVAVDGMFQLIAKGFQRWRMNVDGNIEREIESRGLHDENVLPYYPYREDAVDLFRIILKYARRVVQHYYDSPEKIAADAELQSWRAELAKPQSEGGVGVGGVPGSDEKGFTTTEEIAETIAVIISTCSLGHAAANFQQYEAYGFLPNYPGMLVGKPPTDKTELTEEDYILHLPNKTLCLDIMVITQLLSNRGTNRLGDFEVQYMYEPAGVQAANKLRNNLQQLSHKIKERNKSRVFIYEWLDPEIVPNAISV